MTLSRAELELQLQVAQEELQWRQRVAALSPEEISDLIEELLEGESADPLLEQRLAKMAYGRLADFVRQFWRLLEPGESLVWRWHLELICTELEKVTRGETRDLVINVPPGFAKSLLVSVFWPAWWWLRDPTRRFLTIAATDDLAIRDNGRMREVVESPWYKRLVAYAEKHHKVPRWALQKGDNRKRNFKNDPHKGVRQCYGITGSVMGHRGHGLIIDDPHPPEHLYGEPEAVVANMDATWRRVSVTLDSRVINRRKRWRVLIMQRLHERDVAGRLLAQGKCRHVVLPMRFEPDHPQRNPDDPRTEPGELLDPERFPEHEVVEQEQALEELAGQKEAQLQQWPIRPQGGLFKETWTNNRYDFDPQRPETRFPLVLVTVDAAFKDTVDSSPVSMQAWGIRGANRYLLGEKHGRMDWLTTKAALKDFVALWAPSITIVEEKALGIALLNELKAEIVGLVGFNPDKFGSKMARAQRSVGAWAAGNVFLPLAQYMETVGAYISELIAFPGGARKDRVDAMSQLFLWLAENPQTFGEAVTTGLAGALERRKAKLRR